MSIQRPVKDKAQANRDRVAKHRAGLRAQGLRPKQIWVPDTNVPGFWEQVAVEGREISKRNSEKEALAWAQSVQYWPPEDSTDYS
jgi:Protein  of unknown function (DUF3018)